MSDPISIRLARSEDVPALAALISHSARVLQAPFYSAGQIEAALGTVFDVDGQLIRDGTYFVAESPEAAGKIIGCGGWSRREAAYGGDHARAAGEEAALLDPGHAAARIRAFFVHPCCARRGVGRAILAACESALRAAGFQEAILVATLAGEALYAAAGYVAVKRDEVSLPGGLTLPVVRMTKRF